MFATYLCVLELLIAGIETLVMKLEASQAAGAIDIVRRWRRPLLTLMLRLLHAGGGNE